MKYCKNCNVDVATDENYCPICYSYLEEGDSEEFQLYLKRTKTTKTTAGVSFVKKLFIFLSICAVVICGVIDYMVANAFSWSLVVLASIVYAWVLDAHTIISSRAVFEKIFFQFLALVSLLISLNYISKGSWLVDYVIPAIMLASSGVMSVISLISPKRNSYLLTFFFYYLIFAIVSLIIVLVIKDVYFMLHLLNILYNGLIWLGTLIFGFKRIKSDFAKYMHL